MVTYEDATASTVCWVIAAVATVIWAALKIYGNVRAIRRARAHRQAAGKRAHP